MNFDIKEYVGRASHIVKSTIRQSSLRGGVRWYNIVRGWSKKV